MADDATSSRASRALAEAPVSSCPHCGRETKTVQGVCADCWGVKDPDAAIDLRPSPRTEPLLDMGPDLGDWFGLSPILVISSILGLVVAVAVVVLGLR